MATTAHIADVVEKMRERIAALSTTLGKMSVEIGNPAQFHPYGGADPLVTIFVYRISPDNAAIVATPNSAMAVRIHTLVTVYCTRPEGEGEAAGSHELRLISHIARIFHEKPLLGPVRIREAMPVGQLVQLVSQDLHVEAQLKSLDMEELNHIWTTQGDTPYRTSLVYELVHAFVTPARSSDEGPPVLRMSMAYRDAPAGPYTDGVAPYLVIDNEPAKLPQAIMAFNMGTAAAPVLKPALTLTRDPAQPTLSVTLVAVAETVEPLTLVLHRWDEAQFVWQEVENISQAPAAFETQTRQSLTEGAPLAGTVVTFKMPTAAGTYRFTATKTGAPGKLTVNTVTLLVENPP